MNREIKFRGKRLGSGDWVYGLFYVMNNNPFDVKRHGRKQSYYFERILGENIENLKKNINTSVVDYEIAVAITDDEDSR